MLEILKIIILTCQVSAGGNDYFGGTYRLVDKYQKVCQKSLIKCVDGKELNNDLINYRTLRSCLLERKIEKTK